MKGLRGGVQYLGVTLEKGPMSETKALHLKRVTDTELAASGVKREGVPTLLFPYQSSTSRSGLGREEERAIITKLTRDRPLGSTALRSKTNSSLRPTILWSKVIASTVLMSTILRSTQNDLLQNCFYIINVYRS